MPPDTAPKHEPFEVAPQRDGFWSQLPLVLFAALAVIALLLVNEPQDEAPSAQPTAAPALTQMNSAVATAPTPAQAAADVHSDAAPCSECGEVTAIHVDAPEESKDGAVEQSVVVEIRMEDGTQRLIHNGKSDLTVGDRVRVNGDKLTRG